MPGRYQALMRTRCPACNTVFRVTSDQLRAKAGKVKCGYCQSVFNAFDEFFDDTPKIPFPPVLAPPEIVEAPALQRASARLADALGQAGLPVSQAMVPAEPAQPAPESEAETETEAEAEAEADSKGDQPAEATEEAAAGGAASDIGVEPNSEAVERDLEAVAEIAAIPRLTATEAERETGEARAETVEESTQAARDAGLVAARALAEAPAYNRWATGALDGAEVHQRAAWPFIVALVLLLAALAVQLAYNYRSDLVRHVPAAGELFELLGIDVPLPARSELVSIEASDLQSDNVRGLFVLQATLRNQAAYAQAWPALELTLTDASDTAVARRVLSAADYLPPGSDLTSFPAAAEVPVRLWIDAKGLGAAGYKLYLFYP